MSTERLNGELLIGEFDSNGGASTLRLSPTTGASLPAVDANGVIRMAASPHNVECAHDLCFVAHYQLGLRVFDWSMPNLPNAGALSTFSTWRPSVAGEQSWLQGASGVLLTPSIVYVVDTQNGLFALRLTGGLNTLE